MSSAPDARVDRLLRANLGPATRNRAFAEAVIRHLSTGPAAVLPEVEVAERVLEALQAAAAGAGEPPRRLDHLPEILASFFQNADLLDPGDPTSRAISRWVMTMLETLNPDTP